MLVYFVVPDRMKNLVLLLASLFFYGWGGAEISRFYACVGNAVVYCRAFD